MILIIDKNLIPILINLSILIVALLGSGYLVYKIKFEDNNYRLLFILYTFCWIGPMILREYTSQMHTRMGLSNGAEILPYVLVVYGLIGLIWRPLNDILAFKLNSRKKIIYISLFFQLICYIPMFIHPCLTTNIIQSIGCGIGASCIGLFNLMFNEQHAKQKIFLTVTLLSLPPLIAEFISSVLQSLVTSFLPNQEKGLNPEYLNIVKWMWLIAIIFLFFSAIIAWFVKEDKTLLYKDNQYKEPVDSTSSWIIVVLICLAAIMTSFTKFTTSGPVSITQLDYVATKHWGVNSIKGFDGYLSTIFTIGQIAGNLIIGLVLSKKINEWILFSGATIIWLIFMVLSSTVANWNPGIYLAINVLNGFAFGVAYNIIVNKMIKKFFAKSNIITPMCCYNTALSIGIVASSWFNPWMKKEVFGDLNNFLDAVEKAIKNNAAIPTITDESWNNYIRVNWIVNAIIMGALVLMWIIFTITFFLEKKYPPKLIKVNRQYQSASDMDD